MKPCIVTIAGAGPTGVLLAIFLQRRGFRVTIYERRADPRRHSGESGRSINLALSDRGIHALRAAGAYQRLRGELIPMRGRMVHDGGGAALQPYGQSPAESNHSISRHRLNQLLIDIAAGEHGVQFCFEHELLDVHPDKKQIIVAAAGSAQSLLLEAPVLFGADGANSRVRRRLAELGRIHVDEQPLAHAYKELSIPARSDGQYALAPEALHIWPRQDYMLIALPNRNATFTATLFLPRTGTPSFAALRSAASFDAFFAAEFADVAPLMPHARHEFVANPTGLLGTVHSRPWAAGNSLLLGDAAHAIVPFHGQGMNTCFEDCVELDAHLDAHERWDELFAAFEHERRPQTEAIAAMSLDNYLEMRAAVVDPRYQLQQLLSLELERRHPRRFIPRYSMVAFHHEIPYALAAARGMRQQSILDRLTARATSLEQIDFEAAARAIDSELVPLEEEALMRASAVPRSIGCS